MDIALLAVTVAFFAASWGLALLCDRLDGHGRSATAILMQPPQPGAASASAWRAR